MFFRIERSGPLGGGPARANPNPGSAIRAMITACYRGNGCVLFARLDFPYFRTIQHPAAAFARDSLGPPVRVNLESDTTERKQNLRSFLSSSISPR